MIKAIFFDIDGTLLSHTTKRIPASTARCLAQLREKGIKTIIATGRHLFELQQVPLENIPFDGYITLNGQLVLDQNQKFLCGTPFSQEITDALVKMFNEKSVPLYIIEEKRTYINFINQKVINVQASVSLDPPPVEEYKGEPIYQACSWFEGDEEAELLSKFPEGCRFTHWSEGGIDIIPEAGGKVNGIRAFMEHYQLSQNETMAFGDANNDIDMIAFAGIGVAMGNAEDCVKEVADYVTAHIDEDGIEKALKHFGVL